MWISTRAKSFAAVVVSGTGKEFASLIPLLECTYSLTCRNVWGPSQFISIHAFQQNSVDAPLGSCQPQVCSWCHQGHSGLNREQKGGS